MVVYELFFRDGMVNCFLDVLVEYVIFRMIFDYFLFVLFQCIVGIQILFINFLFRMVIDCSGEVLDKESVVIEIFEDVVFGEVLLQVVKEMNVYGYCFVFDDFIFVLEWDCFLFYIFVFKFDVRNYILV